jgi:thioredoxin 1
MAKMISVIIMGLMLVASVSATNAGTPSAPPSTAEIKKGITSGKKTIIFFLNPNGAPCKAQNEILTKLQKDRKNNFNIAYVSAWQEENRQAFYDYGVRGLPTVVLVDSSGMIARVFSPGIQSYDALASALDGAK